MKYLLLALISLNLLSACDKTWRSKTTEPQDQKSEAAAAGNLEQWSGRSDYVDTRWQIKSRP
jgi:uncharacterized lipoprotein